MHIGQTALDSVVVEGELLVIQAQQVQDRGVEVVDRDRVLRRLVAEIVGGPVTGASNEADPWQSARRVQLRAELRCERRTANRPATNDTVTGVEYRGSGTADYSINRKIGNDPPRAAAAGSEGVRATRGAPVASAPAGTSRLSGSRQRRGSEGNRRMRYTPGAGVRPFRKRSVPTKKAHQALPSALGVEPAPPPIAVPHQKASEELRTPRLRGQEDARHPAEDGQPMASDVFEAREMVDSESVLRHRFKPRDDVYVGIDQLVYYTEGEDPKSVAPDVFVSFDVPSYKRDIYRIAEEGKPPDWVIEIASRSTYTKDLDEKKDLYEEMGVGEYWVYDPKGDMHDPRLRAWVLGPGGYEELADLKRPGLEVALWSEALGLEFHFDGTDLRMWDPVKQSYLPTLDLAIEERDEERRARLAAEARVETAQARAKAAEAERDAEKRTRLALEAELRRLTS